MGGDDVGVKGLPQTGYDDDISRPTPVRMDDAKTASGPVGNLGSDTVVRDWAGVPFGRINDSPCR